MTNYIKRNKILTTIVALLLVTFYFCLPKQLFKDPTATIITSRSNELLGALIAMVGGVLFIIETFKVSWLWCLGCILLLPVSIVFLFLHWDVSKKRFYFN